MSIDHFRRLKNANLEDSYIKLRTVDKTLIQVLGRTEVTVELKGVSIIQEFLIAEIKDECILGLDFLRHNHCLLDFDRHSLVMGSGIELNLRKLSVSCEVALPNVLKEMVNKVSTGIDEGEKKDLATLIGKYQDVFVTNEKELGRTAILQHRINTGDAMPIKQPVRRLPFAKQQVAEEIVQDLLEHDLIEMSESPWSSPIVLVPKKNGKTRMCVDFRQINSVTKKDSWPLPSIEEILESLQGNAYFSKLDLCSGYHQIEMHPDDREKTAFAIGRRLYQYKVMPFGLVNAGASFCRMMNIALRDVSDKECLCYVDDLLIPGKDVKQALCHLEKVFEKLRAAGLKASPDKCTLLAEEIDFLGHKVSVRGVTTSEEKVEIVQKWPIPQNIKEVRQFIGFASYYRKYIKDFSVICKPLYRLSEKNASFC